ncbi:MAG: trimethylamine methyltransferase family protein, partial [Candidatus Thorarchaeota archaeon]|nr:trimethylamine methyltransferase family protein [Candidatus Thorarchaeota archaeon]
MTKENLEDIHSNTLQLLQNTGVSVMNEEAKEILDRAGCSISGDIVKIPESLVKDSLRKTPSTFNLFSREGKESITIGQENVLINPGSSAVYFKDRESREIRKGNSRDLVELVHVVEQLEYINAQSTALYPSDIPEEIAGQYRLYVILKYSSKPIVTGAFSKEDFHIMREMLEVVAGGSDELAKKPQAMFDCCPVSPLIWSDTTCQNLIDCAKAGIPAQIVPAPLMGATSPITIAGTILQSNVEILSGIVISQLVNSGSPLVYGGAIGALDMRYGTPRFNSVESVMAASMSNEIGNYYGLPTHAYLGTSESKTEDSQSGYETGLGIIMGILSGINVISGPGMLAQLNCQSLQKLVIDNEYCGSALKLKQESEIIVLDDVRELISSVGPGGEFLKNRHTLKNYRIEHLFPS